MSHDPIALLTAALQTERIELLNVFDKEMKDVDPRARC